MVVLGVELVVAWTMWAEDADHRIVGGPALGQPVRQLGLAAVAAVAWLAVVMWVGGYMTESGGATACEGWPLCNGSVVPGNDDQEISHMLHRYLAGLLIVFVAWVSVASSRAKQRVRWSRLAVSVLGLLYVGQVTVGALNVWLTFPDPLTMLHTVIASLIWGTLASIAIVSLYEPRARTVAPGVYTRGEAPA
jgi:heme A synthase